MDEALKLEGLEIMTRVDGAGLRRESFAHRNVVHSAVQTIRGAVTVFLSLN